MASIGNHESLNIKLTAIADETSSATSPGTGADATTWTGAQCTAAYNDIVSIVAKLNEIILALEKAGILTPN